MNQEILVPPLDPVLNPAERCALAMEVFDRVYNVVDSFREHYIGSDLAYLMGAILEDETVNGRSWVDWSEEAYGDCPMLLKLFRKLFPAEHRVWKFICGRDRKPDEICDDCGAEAYEIVGCPDGSEICQDCFNQGRH